jgi:hypothetical protein
VSPGDSDAALDAVVDGDLRDRAEAGVDHNGPDVSGTDVPGADGADGADGGDAPVAEGGRDASGADGASPDSDAPRVDVAVRDVADGDASSGDVGVDGTDATVIDADVPTAPDAMSTDTMDVVGADCGGEGVPCWLPAQRLSVGPAGVESDRESLQPSISADGGRVGFPSFGSNLVADDTNHFCDVFVRDLLALLDEEHFLIGRQGPVLVCHLGLE